MYCKKCGSEVSDTAIFCGNCGARIRVQSPEKKPEQEPKQEPKQEHEQVPPASPTKEKEEVKTEAGKKEKKKAEDKKEKREKEEKKEKKKRRLWIPLLILVILAAAAAAVCFLLLRDGGILRKDGGIAGSDESAVLTNFSADSVYFVAGAGDDVTFTVQADRASSAVMLWDEDGNEIGAMHDDGADGDETADDLIYTYVMQTDVENTASVSYFAEAGEQTSESLTLYYFAPLTEEEAAEAQTGVQGVSEEMAALEDSYAGTDGYVPEDSYDELMTSVEEFLAEQKDAGIVLLYEIEDASVYIKFTCGLALIYQPNVPDTSLGDSDVELTCMTYQPNPDIANDWAPETVTEVADYLGVSATSYEGSEVTLERIKSLGSDQIIFWNGHGGYESSVGSYLLSGEAFDWSAWFWDVGYFADFVTNRVVCASSEAQSDMAAVTSQFIEHYCGDLSNDIIFLASCESAVDSRLADSFLAKGATAVLGFTETVYTAYALNICGFTLAYLNDEDVTLQEALNMAEDDFGESDLQYAREHTDWKDIKSSEAEPVLFGGNAAEQYKLPFGWLSGTVTEDSLESGTAEADGEGTPISWALVTAYRDGEEVDSAVTAEDGTYELRLPIGKYKIVYTAYGYSEETVDRVTITEQETLTQDAALEPVTATLTGVAYDREDESVVLGGITVTAVYTDKTGVTDESDKSDETDENGETGARVYTFTAVTEDDGTYELELPPGTYKVTVSTDSGKYQPMKETTTVNLSEDEENTYDIPVNIAACLYGYVYDEDGDPLGGVAVSALSNERIELSGTTTDDDGYYEILCYDMSYNISFSLEGYDTAEYTLEIDFDTRLNSNAENMSRIDDVVLYAQDDEEDDDNEDNEGDSEGEIPSDTLSWNGHHYCFFDVSYTWEEAEAYCESLGGHLVTITSAEEQEAVYAYVSAIAGDEDIFIGLSDEGNEGDWSTWVTGEAVGYTNWGENEPDDLGGQNYGVLCTGYRGHEGGSYYVTPGQWDDNFTSSSTAHFICEWDW